MHFISPLDAGRHRRRRTPSRIAPARRQRRAKRGRTPLAARYVASHRLIIAVSGRQCDRNRAGSRRQAEARQQSQRAPQCRPSREHTVTATITPLRPARLSTNARSALVLLLCWRDIGHPRERSLSATHRGSAGRTALQSRCAPPLSPGAPRHEPRRGGSRAGGRYRYLWALLAMAAARCGLRRCAERARMSIPKTAGRLWPGCGAAAVAGAGTPLPP